MPYYDNKNGRDLQNHPILIIIIFSLIENNIFLSPDFKLKKLNFKIYFIIV